MLIHPVAASEIRSVPTGWVAIAMHWLVAVSVIGLAILGLWMTDLTYLQPLLPQVRLSGTRASALRWQLSCCCDCSGAGPIRARHIWPSHKPWETRLASLGCTELLYLLLIAIVVSGYLIFYRDRGRAIDVFGWFTLPALVDLVCLPRQTVPGLVHYWLAISMLVLGGHPCAGCAETSFY